MASPDTVVNVLSIDAWADGDDGWTWNNWHKVGTCELSKCDLPPAELVAFMISEGYLHDAAAGRVEVEDDQYNMVILDAETREPLFALEYGPPRCLKRPFGAVTTVAAPCEQSGSNERIPRHETEQASQAVSRGPSRESLPQSRGG